MEIMDRALERMTTALKLPFGSWDQSLGFFFFRVGSTISVRASTSFRNLVLCIWTPANEKIPPLLIHFHQEERHSSLLSICYKILPQFLFHHFWEYFSRILWKFGLSFLEMTERRIHNNHTFPKLMASSPWHNENNTVMMEAIWLYWETKREFIAFSALWILSLLILLKNVKIWWKIAENWSNSSRNQVWKHE